MNWVFSGRYWERQGPEAGSLKVHSGSGKWTSLTAGEWDLSWEQGRKAGVARAGKVLVNTLPCTSQSKREDSVKGSQHKC